MAVNDLDLGKYSLGWSDDVEYAFKAEKGINEDVVRNISLMKGEPDWMTASVSGPTATSCASRWLRGSR